MTHTLHLVLRSSNAKGAWSFTHPGNDKAIRRILMKFSKKHGVKIISVANVGNHLHMQIKLGNRYTYPKFIRAITSAIMMAVTKTSRWKKKPKELNPAENPDLPKNKCQFWDLRPFTRIVESFRAYLNLRDYIRLNQAEGLGYTRKQARWILQMEAYLRP